MWKRIVTVAWAIACVVAGASAAIQMLVTFAPSHGRTGELASAELAGIERARNFWLLGVWTTSALLIVNAALVVAYCWKRR